MNTQSLARSTYSEEDRLEDLLLRRLGSRIRDLRVQVFANGIVLQGRAATYHAKQLAQHAAMDICGYPILANDIEVYYVGSAQPFLTGGLPSLTANSAGGD